VKRQLPVVLTFICAFVLTVQFFVPHRTFEQIYEVSNIWLQIIGVFTIIIGIVSLVESHVRRIRRREAKWRYSIITLAGLGAMVVGGFFGSIEATEQRSLFNWLYDYVLNPVSATMFSLLAFFIASAAFRAFRLRSVLATILLLAAVLVMLGRVPLGDRISGGVFPALANWLLNVPNVAAKRAILIGVGLGEASMALRVMLGIERSYMAGE
jgi:hypothetical protein